MVSEFTGLRTDAALLVVSQVSLAGAFVIFAAYLRIRFPEINWKERAWILLAFGVWPSTCFSRFAYSESMLLLLAVLALYGMEMSWPLWLIALTAGAATATRSVGVALLGPLALHIWRRSSAGFSPYRYFFCYGALACWGLAAYMAFQWAAFGNPPAFLQTQQHWHLRPAPPFSQKLASLGALEPIWEAFDPGSRCYWRYTPAKLPAILNYDLANRFLFLLAVGLLVVGWRRGWLSAKEVALTVLLVAIPYLVGYEMCMWGMGRFVAVAFPLYIVAGKLLNRLPWPVAAALCALSAFFLAAYSAMFAAGCRVI